MKTLPAGTIHEVLPSNLKLALQNDSTASELWRGLTPLARNEWICWTISPKLAKTREQHVARVISELKEGVRRPCCWIGCTHRTDKSLSPSVQSIIDRQT